MNRTVTEILSIQRTPLRRMRAESLAHAAFSAIEQYIAPEDHLHCLRAMMELFMEQGVEVITDLDRAKYGLPLRDETGWTQQEIVTMEHLKTLAMISPFVFENGKG